MAPIPSIQSKRESMQSLTLLASSFSEPGTYHLTTCSPQICLGISPGHTTPFSRKIHPNEDSCASFIHQDWFGGLVADAHWGKESGEIVTQRILHFLQNHSFPALPTDLEQLFCDINKQLAQEMKEKEVQILSETSLLLAGIHQTKKQYVLGSYGDCYCFLFSQSQLRDLSFRLNTWLGVATHLASIQFHKITEIEQFLAISRENAQFLGMLSQQRIPLPEGLKIQVGTLESGDILLLCSDGLVETIYGIPTVTLEILQHIFQEHHTHLSSLGEALFQEALRKDRLYRSEVRGGEDNISFILLQCP